MLLHACVVKHWNRRFEISLSVAYCEASHAVTLYSSEEPDGAKDDSFLRYSSATADCNKGMKRSAALSSSNPDLVLVGTSARQETHLTGDLEMTWDDNFVENPPLCSLLYCDYLSECSEIKDCSRERIPQATRSQLCHDIYVFPITILNLCFYTLIVFVLMFVGCSVAVFSGNVLKDFVSKPGC